MASEGKRAYIFFSVHEKLFHRVATRLRGHGVTEVGGFVWGEQQERELVGKGIDYSPLVVFTRDLLPQYDGEPDLAWLEQRERELGISIQRMISAERHLLAGRSFSQIMRMAEVALRTIADVLDRSRPDFLFSEDISCFHSYVHFVLARERGIPFWCIGSGRMPDRLSVYSSGMQHWERVDRIYQEIRERGLTPDERAEGTSFVEAFRAAPKRPTGMETRAAMPGLGKRDLLRLRSALTHYFGDRGNPTTTPPVQVIKQRFQRIARIRLADATHRFEQPVAGEKYVLYPIHFQPEASTLVQAPLYLDQVALLQDVARSLPVGHRLYVKEHLSNRGRRPLAFYDQLRAIPAVRLLGPDTDTWSLIENAAAIAVITGTMGWEGLLFDKPVVTFGDIFYNVLPHVHRAADASKDRWYNVFRTAIFDHKPDHDALLALVVAMRHGSFPGFMKNPNTFPQVMKDDNVAAITRALAEAASL